ncbi:MAG: hypothetical protein KAT76_04770 [Bacteroidales bacterium]|nr:hypothetical protein [Bacteroidales bacterium]
MDATADFRAIDMGSLWDPILLITLTYAKALMPEASHVYSSMAGLEAPDPRGVEYLFYLGQL